MTQYLTDGTGTISDSTCPVCQTPVALVVDGLAYDNKDDTVFFKYSKHQYQLTVTDNRFSLWRYLSFRSRHLAQDRISKLLHIKDLRILCKGKVIYPDLSKTEEDLSQLLLDLSASSVQNKKAPLVVMGTRAGQELRNRDGIGSVFIVCLSMINSLLYGTMKWMYQFAMSIFLPALPPAHED